MTSSKTQKPLDSETVRQLADILNDTNLTEIEYELGDAKIRVARQMTAAPVAHMAPAPMAAPTPQLAADTPASTPSEPADLSKHAGAVKSPMVGNAYRSPAPDAAPFVQEGDTVKAGDSVLIIEAMKVMNQIKAHKDGVIKQILVKDGDPVEFDDILLIIE